MDLIIPFRLEDYSSDGTHLSTDRFILDVQIDWEEAFHNKFNPLYANVIEGHPSAMLRLTRYMDAGEETEYDFGMEPINGGIDIDANIEIDKHSRYNTVYAIGSRLAGRDDEPIFLLKNDGLREDILLLKYVPDDDDEETEPAYTPVDIATLKQ
jgi:hypothetical protein